MKKKTIRRKRRYTIGYFAEKPFTIGMLRRRGKTSGFRKVRGNPKSSFADFRAFLSETLIPDLKESGYEFTAEDFERIVRYMTHGKDREYPKFRAFILGRLVPDLRKSGRTYTARDFVRGIKFIDKGMSVKKRVIRKNPAARHHDITRGLGWLAWHRRKGKGIETKIERLRKIVSERQNAVVQGVRVDLYSASAIVSVYDKLSPENQRKYSKMSVPKMADVAFRIIQAREVKSNPGRYGYVVESVSRSGDVKLANFKTKESAIKYSQSIPGGKVLRIPKRRYEDVGEYYEDVERAVGVRRNPVNEALQILTPEQILAEYKKGGEGQQAKLMFTSKPMSGMSASQLVRKIGNYNNFSWRKVSPFLGKLHFMNQSLTLPMTFRVGREYSPAIYIENVDMPRYANRLIEYAQKKLNADEATYTPVARRVRLWWD